MHEIKKEAVILKKRELINDYKQKDDLVFYDLNLQLWVNRTTRKPVVLQNGGEERSPFGETTLKETKEGSDQEILSASPFGETSLKKSSEGSDVYDPFLMSQFGETSITKGREGADHGDFY